MPYSYIIIFRMHYKTPTVDLLCAVLFRIYLSIYLSLPLSLFVCLPAACLPVSVSLCLCLSPFTDFGPEIAACVRLGGSRVGLGWGAQKIIKSFIHHVIFPLIADCKKTLKFIVNTYQNISTPIIY